MRSRHPPRYTRKKPFRRPVNFDPVGTAFNAGFLYGAAIGGSIALALVLLFMEMKA